MSVKYFKVRGEKQMRIRGTPDINSLLGKGFSVSKITMIGNKTSIDTFSPRTFNQAMVGERSFLTSVYGKKRRHRNYTI